MADDVTFGTPVATPPSGTKVATDDVAGVHYQRMKLDLGGNGLSDPVVGALPSAITALTTWQAGQVTVGLSAVQVAASPLTGRKTITVRALTVNSVAVYVASSSAVSTSTGYELSAGEGISLEVDASAGVWAIASSAGQAVCFLEVA